MMVLCFFLQNCISLKYELSTNKTVFTVYGENEVLTKENVEESKLNAGYLYIIINAGITAIGSKAFTGCPLIRYVSFNSQITEIADSAFVLCKYLTSIKLPEGLIKIGSLCFDQAGLINISLPTTLDQIGEDAFGNLVNLQRFITKSNSIYTALDEGKFLVRGTELFAAAASYAELTLPAGISKIGRKAFHSNTKLQNLKYAPGYILTEVNEYAFRGCYITKIEFPEGVTKLGSSIFDRSRVSTLILPSSLISVDDNFLKDATSLSSVTVAQPCNGLYVENGVIYNKQQNLILFMPPGIDSFTIKPTVDIKQSTILPGLSKLKILGLQGTHWRFEVENNTLYEKSTNRLFSAIGGATDVTVISKCQIIGGSSFKQSNIERVTFTGVSVHTIENSAFEGCKNLKSVVLKEGLKTINGWAFANCGRIELVLPSTIESLSTSCFRTSNIINIDMVKCERLESISESGFEASSVEIVKLGGNLKRLQTKCFMDCKSLKSIVIPESAESIEEQSFKNSGLEEIEFEDNSRLSTISTESFSSIAIKLFKLPDQIKSIDSNAFTDCTKLESFICNTEGKLETISPYIFSGCSLLTSLRFGKNLKTIMPCAFTHCSNLKTIEIDSSNPYLESISGCVYSEMKDIFYVCPPAKDFVELESAVTEIADSAFFDCTKLTTVTFEQPAGLTKIGSSTFCGCTALSTIELPIGLRWLLDSCFSGCNSLSTVTFLQNSRIESIGKSAFSSCSITSIDMSPCMYLTQIDSSAFASCSKLSTFVLPRNLQTVSSDSFVGCDSLRYIKYCPIKHIEGLETQINMKGYSASVDVPLSYNADLFWGLPVVKRFDSDCMLPTMSFTSIKSRNSHNMLLVAVIVDDE